jgi:hypothetical protein
VDVYGGALIDWTAIIDRPQATRRPILRFRKAKDRIVVEAQDLGYALQIWTVRIVGRDRQTIALSRFHDPVELEQDVTATKSRYLSLGWSEE